MGLRSSGYRPAHTAHGAVYWHLVMLPLSIGRAMVLGGRRGLESQRLSGDERARHTGFPPSAPASGRRVPPPPPPPRSSVPVAPWGPQEGFVRPKWEERAGTG